VSGLGVELERYPDRHDKQDERGAQQDTGRPREGALRNADRLGHKPSSSHASCK
jgi:hypothetical protein